MQQQLDYALYPKNRDLGKTWFLAFNVNGQRVKRYGNLNNLLTLSERLNEAKRIVSEFNREEITAKPEGLAKCCMTSFVYAANRLN